MGMPSICEASREDQMRSSVELFAGAGGLALGISNAGFKHKAVVEWNADACKTIRVNQALRVKHVSDWKLYHADVRDFDFSAIEPDVDLLAAGVPCQPWSIGGKHRGFEDDRNLFPDTIRAVVALRPKAILIENVKGLTRQSFANYFSYIQFMLEFPETGRRVGENWLDHRMRLEKQVSSRGKGSSYEGLHCNVVPQLINAANYGIPQRRERVFLVAFRDDLGVEWSFPEATHSQEALWADQWLDGAYWDRHRVASKDRPFRPPHVEKRLEASSLVSRKPWRTVRDVISDLPEPVSGGSRLFHNHMFQAGARAYTGHTGSPLDEPSKTIKAGDHGVPGGENMILFPDGRVRYFTVRETARIQTFPDEYVFGTSWTENMRQLGNAVPVELGQQIAKGIKRRLAGR